MTEQTEITAKQRSFQYQIWLMLIVVFGVILAGFLMVPKTEEQRLAMMKRMGTTNQGELISPTVDMSPPTGLPCIHNPSGAADVNR